MEMVFNEFILCMTCQDTHHESEDCPTCSEDDESPLLPEAFDLIKQTPGIDTPRLCLMLNRDVPDPNFRGVTLAKWLMENHQVEWEDTCVAVDQLIETGDISFSDDGELRANGY